MPATPPVSGLQRAVRLLTSPEARLQAAGVLALALVGAGAALLLPPASVAGDLPGEESLGTVATRSVKANRDYTIPDPEATAALRDEAMQRVRPVYDFDAAAGEHAESRVALAFSFAREKLAEADSPPQAARKKGRREPAQVDPVATLEPHYAEFVKLLQAVVDVSEFAELSRTRFNPEVERGASVLLRGVLAGEIAPSRELLFAERERGITIRSVDVRGPKGERESLDVERIPDLAAVRTDLLRLAIGLGEMPNSTTGVTRSAMALPADLPAIERRVAALIAARVARSNLAYNGDETERRQRAAGASVKPVVLQYVRGEKILGDGDRIEKRHLLALRFVAEQARAIDTVQVRLGAALFAVLVSLSVFGLARRTVRRFRPSKRDLVFLAAVLVGNLALLRAGMALCELLRDRAPWLTNDVSAFLLPLAAGTMLVRMLRSGESSVVFTLVFTPLVALQLSAAAPAAVGLVAAVVAAEQLGRRTGRGTLALAALQSALAGAATVAALALFHGRLLLPETATQAAAAAIGAGILSPLAALLVSPICEALFGYTSETELARLANLNHPVLKELIIKAPGTYHHSLIVGDLAAAAAERIGANPLLARVGGYYHDLGKAAAPLLFGENQKAENRLEKMPPKAAAEAVVRHVSDGLELARRARLPRVVQDFVVQHHGTRLAGSFLHQARAEAERDGLPAPEPEAFHYPGPRPRAREVAIVLLADVVEAASRSLPDATPERLRALVPRVVEPLVLEGQLDECDLTLADVGLVIEAFQESIESVHGLTRVDVLPGLRAVGATGVLDPDRATDRKASRR